MKGRFELQQPQLPLQPKHWNQFEPHLPQPSPRQPSESHTAGLAFSPTAEGVTEKGIRMSFCNLLTCSAGPSSSCGPLYSCVHHQGIKIQLCTFTHIPTGTNLSIHPFPKPQGSAGFCEVNSPSLEANYFYFRQNPTPKLLQLAPTAASWS